MKELAEYYLNLIVTERQWSWALMAIVYFMVLMAVRGWFIKPLIRRAKVLDKKYFQLVKSEYKGRCVPGWIMIIFSIAIFGYTVYQMPSPYLEVKECFLLLGALTTFMAGVMLHLTAFGLAVIEAFNRNANDQLLV